MKKVSIITFITFSCLLSIVASHTNAETKPTIKSVTPDTVFVGKNKDIVIEFDSVPSGAQFSLSPGGPYIKDSLNTDHINDMAVIGDVAFVITDSNKLSSIDLGDSDKTVIQTHLAFEDKLAKLAITKQAAIVAGQSSLYMIDLSDTLNPEIAGRLTITDTILAIHIDHSHAFLLTNKNKLLVVDISIMTSPSLAGRYDLKNNTVQLAGNDGHLFLAQAEHGIAVLDISDITNIKNTGHYQTTGPALDIRVDNNIAYVASGIAGLTLFDVSNPGHILWLGSHQKLGYALQVFLPINNFSDKYVVIVNNEHHIHLIDINNPAMPTIHSGMSLPSDISNILLSGTSAYVSSDDEFLTIDFSPISPQLSNDGLDYGQGVNLGGQRRVFLRENIAYVADWFSGIHIYDISTPQAPGLLSSLHTPGSPKGIVVKGDYAYVADDDHGLQILDITDPQQPAIISNIQTPGLAYHPVLDGNKLYLASHRGGFQIIDISDARNPGIIGQYDTPGMAWAIQVKDDIAYVADDDSGLLIFNISQPDSPRLIAQFQPGGAAEDILINDNIAYVAFFDRGITILDISSPENPKMISHIDTPGNARGLDIYEHYLVVSDWLAGIHIIDINVPANPAIVASYDTDGAAWGARVNNNNAYVMDWWGGFTTLDLTNPKHIKLAGHYPEKDTIEQIITQDKFAFVANGKAGLQVFDINNPLNPTWLTGIDLDIPAKSIVIENQTLYIGQSNDIAIVDISNPYSAAQVRSFPITHATNILHSTDGRLYVAEQGMGLTIYDNSNATSLITNQFLNIAVNDFCVVDKKLYIATNEGLFVYYMSDTGKHTLREYYRTNQPSQLIRIKNNYIYVYLKGHGIMVFYDNGDTITTLTDMPYTNIKDMQIDDNMLYLLTQYNELVALDISKQEKWRILSTYQLQNNATRLHAHNGIIYMSGNTGIIAIKPVTKAVIMKIDNTTLQLKLPEDLPIGNYDVVVTYDTGKSYRFNNTFQLMMPRFSKPKFSMDDLNRIMESKKLIKSPDDVFSQ